MSSGILFILVGLVVLLVTALLVFKRPQNVIEYFKTEKGKGALSGILVFMGVAFLIVVASSKCSAAETYPKRWLTYAEVFVGMDKTFNQSPQCKSGGVDEKFTSNGGIRLNLYRTYDKKFHANFKYTHHSCAFGEDRNSYDAGGIELIYRFWGSR